jgi:uncharacterized protein YdiU (UPF0061 family)
MGWRLENSYGKLPDFFYTKVEPNKVREPKWVIFNHSLAAFLGLDVDASATADWQTAEGAKLFAGNVLPNGAEPLAQAYAGHQFGHFTMLGDGRAILIGEQITPVGARFDIQLKGSGKTPYSRRGDGKAALGPMLREYIISEAMHALGIATTRSLAVVTTGERVYRETDLPGAVLTRVAASHLRVGTFEYAAAWGGAERVRELADYAMARHYPQIKMEADEQRYTAFLRAVMERQATLIAQWQAVGFVHGVMNTDNMAISGETIDYGPCAFMDTYKMSTVFSSIDSHGRYAYGNQPKIAAWNLARLAESLLSILATDEEQALALANAVIGEFPDLFREKWLAAMCSKLGLSGREQVDEPLIEDLLELMEMHYADYTNTFCELTTGLHKQALFETDSFTAWYNRWQARLQQQNESHEVIQKRMENANPVLIARNHRVEEALTTATHDGDLSVLYRLLDALANPFDYSEKNLHANDSYFTEPSASVRPYRTFCGT